MACSIDKHTREMLPRPSDDRSFPRPERWCQLNPGSTIADGNAGSQYTVCTAFGICLAW